MAENNEGQGGEKELTPEQKNTLETGRQSDGAMQPDKTGKPSKEALNEEHGELDDKGNKKAKPEDKKEGDPEKEPEKEPEDNSWKDKYVEIDNPHAQAAINLLKEAKVSPVEANDIFKDAIASGELDKVDWARLEKLVGKDKALLIKSGITAYYDGEYKEARATEALAYELFGGEDGWDKARKHFQKEEKKDPKFKKELDGMRKAINQGGWAAQQALNTLKGLYNKAPNTTGTGRDKLVEGDNLPSNDQGLSKEDYRKELDKLGGNPNYRDIEALRNRRKIALAREMGSR